MLFLSCAMRTNTSHNVFRNCSTCVRDRQDRIVFTPAHQKLLNTWTLGTKTAHGRLRQWKTAARSRARTATDCTSENRSWWSQYLKKCLLFGRVVHGYLHTWVASHILDHIPGHRESLLNVCRRVKLSAKHLAKLSMMPPVREFRG